MKNLSLSNLFKCHLIYTAVVRVAFTDTAIVKDFVGLSWNKNIYHIGKTPFTTLKNYNFLELLKAIIPILIT